MACHADPPSVVDKLYESPEFVRFQMISPISELLDLEASDSLVPPSLTRMRTCTNAHMHTCTHAHMHTCTHAHMIQFEACG